MTSHLKIFFGFLLCFLCSISLANTTTPPIIIGTIYNLSGSQSPLDQASLNGARLAVKEINAAGGLLGGRQLVLDVADGKTMQNIITAQAKRLAHDKSASGIIIGLSDTDMAVAAIPEIAAAKKLFVTSGATSPKLTSLGPNSVVMICIDDANQAARAADFAFVKLGAKHAYLFTQSDSEYTHLVSQFFKQRFSELGGDIVDTVTFTSNKLIDTKKLAALKKLPKQADVIYLAADPDTAPLIVNQIRQNGLMQPIIGGDSFDNEILLAAIKKDISNLYFTTHGFIDVANPDAKVQKFIADYIATYHEAPTTSFTGLGYDTIKIIAKAIQIAGTTDPQKVRDALLSIENYHGITGVISYVNNNPIPRKTVSIIKITAGKKTNC
ncbi:MAG: ABC transporter substrate-binding protein [Gammaproteobacteria bacterium]|nr:ABC transporter substrate-binding protein [Gammaproteobacteria bacterium]